METDFNLKKETCLNDKPEDTPSLKELQKNALLQRIEQEFNENSLVKKKKLKVHIAFNTSYPDGYRIEIFPEGKKDKPGEEILFFGYCGSEDLLTEVLLEMDKEIHLFYDRTMVHVFVAMLISDDLSKFHKKMYLACLTTEFKCLVDILKPFCKSFNPTTVAKCGLFVSHMGTPIHKGNLYNSPLDDLATKQKMERIGRKLC